MGDSRISKGIMKQWLLGGLALLAVLALLGLLSIFIGGCP